jgi:hypothetical protein
VVFKFEERVTGNVTIFDSKLFAIQKIDITDPVDELSVALPKGIFMPTGIVNGKQISNPAPFSIKGIEEVVAEVRILL